MKRFLVLVLMVGLLSGCQIIPNFLLQSTAAAETPTLQAASTPILPGATFTQSPSATPVLVSSTPIPARPWILISKDLVAKGDKPPYVITIHYPEISGDLTAGLQEFNVAARQQAQEILAGFQKDFSNAQDLPDLNLPGSFAEANQKVTYGQNGILSVAYTVGFYYSGAAHPNSYTFVFNFDLIHGKKIELADIFTPGVDYLKIISDYCTADLKKQARLEFTEGALPKSENYKSWNVTPQGILFTFDPYQVGPYAMGPSTVTIPYSALKSVLKTSGPLALFTN